MHDNLLNLQRLALILIAASLLVATTAAYAQTPYPARPVRWIVPSSPGGGLDIMTRTVAQKLTERLGHAFIVENRPGASGVIGQDLAAKAAPDGHMLVTVASPLTILPYLMKNLPYKGTGPALVDLLGGRTQFMMANVLSVAHHVEAGKVRALGVSSTRRSAALPNVPPIGESVPGYDVVQWYGVAGLTPQ